MHAIHFILVSADCESTDSQLYDLAASAIERYGDGEVWDWYDEGPGRWSDIYPNPISLARETERFFAMLAELRSWKRKDYLTSLGGLAIEFNIISAEVFRETLHKDDEGIWDEQFGRYTKEVGSKLMEKIHEVFMTDSGIEYAYWLYNIRSIIDKLYGIYRHSSNFFNSIDETPLIPTDSEITQMAERLAEGETLFLVPLDLHN